MTCPLSDTYRGWLIEQNWLGKWEATGPNFDASYEGPEDGWVSNGEAVFADTRAELIEEIDAYIEEHGA